MEWSWRRRSRLRVTAGGGPVVALACGGDALVAVEAATVRGRPRMLACEAVPLTPELLAAHGSPGACWRAVLPRLVARRRWGGRRAVVVLDGGRVAARLWAAPPLSPRDRLGALAFEAEKWCQLPAARLWVGAIERDGAATAHAGRDEEENALAVAAPREAVVPLLEAAATAGLEPWGVSLPPLALASLLGSCGAGADASVRVAVHVGAERSWLIVISGGQLLMLRELEIACDGLIGALAVVPVEGQGNVRLSPEEAAALLARVGVVMDDEPFGMADEHLPLESLKFALRPALERLASSISRSLDFCREQYFVELPDNFALTGEGAAVPALDAYLAAATLARCERGVGWEGRLDASPEAAKAWEERPGLAAVAAGAAVGALGGRVLPSRAAACGLARWVAIPVRRALAAAAVLILLAWGLAGQRAGELRSRAGEEAARVAALETRLATARADWRALEASRAEQFLTGEHARRNVRVDGILKLLSRIVGPEVALTELSLPNLNAELLELGAPAAAAPAPGARLPQERDVATLVGVARTDRERLESILSRLIVDLERAPYFEQVAFVRSEEEDDGVARFELRCRIRQGLRESAARPEVASR